MTDRPDDGFVIRDATADDAPAIAEIYNQSITAGDSTMDEVLWTVESVRAKLAGFGPRETILVLVEAGNEDEDNEGAIAGWGIIKKYSDRRGYRFACETAVYLKRDIVRRGFGTRIKLALIARCREWGYRHLVARIFASNQASIQYNLKLGYEIVGTQRDIGFRNGRWQDVTILQLVLPPPKSS